MRLETETDDAKPAETSMNSSINSTESDREHNAWIGETRKQFIELRKDRIKEMERTYLRKREENLLRIQVT